MEATTSTTSNPAGRGAAVGVFRSREEAERAVRALRDAGFRDDQIGFAQRGETGPASTTVVEEAHHDHSAGLASGLVSGGLLGGLIGAAAALLLPGIGPVVAGGILATTLGGAGVGAVAGGVLGALTGMGVYEHEAEYYDQEFQAGRPIVTVKTDGRYDQALEILRGNGAYDSDARPGAAATPTTSGAVAAGAAAAGTMAASSAAGAAAGAMAPGAGAPPYATPAGMPEMRAERAPGAAKAASAHGRAPGTGEDAFPNADEGTAGVWGVDELNRRSAVGSPDGTAPSTLDTTGTSTERDTSGGGSAAPSTGQVKSGETGGDWTPTMSTMGVGVPSSNEMSPAGTGTAGTPTAGSPSVGSVPAGGSGAPHSLGSGQPGGGTAAQRWDDVSHRYRSRWEKRYGDRGFKWDEYEPGYRYSWERSRHPDYQNKPWEEIEPAWRQDWETRYRDADWDKVSPTIRWFWEDLVIEEE